MFLRVIMCEVKLISRMTHSGFSQKLNHSSTDQNAEKHYQAVISSLFLSFRHPMLAHKHRFQYRSQTVHQLRLENLCGMTSFQKELSATAGIYSQLCFFVPFQCATALKVIKSSTSKVNCPPCFPGFQTNQLSQQPSAPDCSNVPLNGIFFWMQIMTKVCSVMNRWFYQFFMENNVSLDAQCLYPWTLMKGSIYDFTWTPPPPFSER